MLLLCEVEGLSTEETAACLEVSTDVERTRLRRARTMLRDAKVPLAAHVCRRGGHVAGGEGEKEKEHEKQGRRVIVG